VTQTVPDRTGSLKGTKYERSCKPGDSWKRASLLIEAQSKFLLARGGKVNLARIGETVFEPTTSYPRHQNRGPAI
jgi:hypothetical protein